MVELFANSGDPDQTPHSAASDLGLHCLPVTLLGVSRLQSVKRYKVYKEHFEFLIKMILFLCRSKSRTVIAEHQHVNQ